MVCVLCILVVVFMGRLISIWVEFVVVFLDRIEVMSWFLLFRFSGCLMWMRMLLVGLSCIELF